MATDPKKTASSPINVVEISNRTTEFGAVIGRRPMVYLPETSTLYIGQEGFHHQDVISQMPEYTADGAPIGDADHAIAEGELTEIGDGEAVFHLGGYGGVRGYEPSQQEIEAAKTALIDFTGLDIDTQEGWRSRTSGSKTAMSLSPDSPGLPTEYYHVSPARNHEKIMREGLVPGTESTSPWTEERGKWGFDPRQPSGTYLWDDEDNALGYANTMASLEHDLPETKDGWIDSNPEWFDWSEGWEPEDPEDIPPEVEEAPSWNVYRIPASAVKDVRMDPEPWAKGDDTWAKTYDEAMEEIEGHLYDDDIYADDRTGHRYYTPHPISNTNIELANSKSLKDMDVYGDMEEEQDDPYFFHRQAPEPLSRVPDLMASPLADPNWTWDQHRRSHSIFTCPECGSINGLHADGTDYCIDCQAAYSEDSKTPLTPAEVDDIATIKREQDTEAPRTNPPIYKGAAFEQLRDAYGEWKDKYQESRGGIPRDLEGIRISCPRCQSQRTHPQRLDEVQFCDDCEYTWNPHTQEPVQLTPEQIERERWYRSTVEDENRRMTKATHDKVGANKGVWAYQKGSAFDPTLWGGDPEPPDPNQERIKGLGVCHNCGSGDLYMDEPYEYGDPITATCDNCGAITHPDNQYSMNTGQQTDTGDPDTINMVADEQGWPEVDYESWIDSERLYLGRDKSGADSDEVETVYDYAVKSGTLDDLMEVVDRKRQEVDENLSQWSAMSDDPDRPPYPEENPEAYEEGGPYEGMTEGQAWEVLNQWEADDQEWQKREYGLAHVVDQLWELIDPKWDDGSQTWITKQKTSSNSQPKLESESMAGRA